MKDERKVVSYYDSGNVKSEKTYDENNKLNSFNNEPAVVEYDEIGNTKFEFYYKHGFLHREDGPAKIYFYNSGDIKEYHYFLNGKYERMDSSLTLVKFYGTGKVRSEFFNYNDCNLIKVYYRNGNIESENWYNKERYRDRKDKPALTYYSKKGKKIREVFYKDGKIHRLNDAAVLIYDVNGKKTDEMYYIDNELFTDDFLFSVKSMTYEEEEKED